MSRLVGMVVDDGIERGRDHDADTTAHDRASTRRAAAVVVALHALLVLAIVPHRSLA